MNKDLLKFRTLISWVILLSFFTVSLVAWNGYEGRRAFGDQIPLSENPKTAQTPVSSTDSSATKTISLPLCKPALPLSLPGLPNLHKVTKDLYRGAQPTREGFRELEKMGIKTVINLRHSHSDTELIRGTRLDYIHIRTHAWDLNENDVVRFLKVATDQNRTPVFVHCQHEADRTGVMCALYRITVCGWSRKQAIEEMTRGGFGYHRIWRHLAQFIQNIDLNEISPGAGVRKPQNRDK